MNYRQPFIGEHPITQRFGETITDPNGHTGIDYLCYEGTVILASETGTVIAAGWDNHGYGYRVIIRHPDGYSTIYAHLKSIAVKPGQRVRKGEIIGYSGNTGNSTGAHLHFEVRNQENKAFDPMNLPLHSEYDSVDAESATTQTTQTTQLKGADQLGKDVEIVCPNGAWGWSPDFSRRATVYPQGTKLTFTGKTTERMGYKYCEVYPAPLTYWVAVNDGTTQILDNAE